MSDSTTFVPGDYNAVCDECGFEFKASQLRKRWDGYRVCPKDWEPRHPQEFLRAKPETTRVPWARPEGADAFVASPYDLYTEDGETMTTEDGAPITV